MGFSPQESAPVGFFLFVVARVTVCLGDVVLCASQRVLGWKNSQFRVYELQWLTKWRKNIDMSTNFVVDVWIYRRKVLSLQRRIFIINYVFI